MTANSNKTTKKPKRVKKLSAHVTHLEMSHHPQHHIPVPTWPIIALMRAKNIPVQFYRYVYEMVGKPYHWEDRRYLPDCELYSTINDETAEIHVLYADA